MMKLKILIAFYTLIKLALSISIVTIAQASQDKSLTIKSFCTGYYMSCAVFSNGKLKCAGYGGYVGFGDSYAFIGDSLNEIGDNLPYINLGTNAIATKVTCGVTHVCVKLNTNQIKCMGYNENGQCGIGAEDINIDIVHGYTGDALPAVNIGTGIDIVDVVAGYWHNCVIVTGNLVKCFGIGGASLGYEDYITRGKVASTMGNSLNTVNLGTNVQVSSLHSNTASNYICAIISTPASAAQRFKCWGDNTYRQLGYGDKNHRGDSSGEMGDNLPLVDLGFESRVKLISTSGGFTCALIINDNVKCWGRGEDGRLGSGSTVDTTATGNGLPFLTIDSGKTVKLLATGLHHTCIVYDNYLTMKCIGRNLKGQLGQGDTTPRGNVPTNMIPSIPPIQLGTDSLKIRSIHAGGDITCVVYIDDSVKCFGDNTGGGLVIGDNTNIGDEPNEMGGNLQFAKFFSPTKSPTMAPSNSPSELPSLTPSKMPSFSPSISQQVSDNPTTTPSRKPSKNPTRKPTKSPFKKPTISPSPLPSIDTSTSTPSIMSSSNPTISPTLTLSPYYPSKIDCYLIPDASTCFDSTKSSCGRCVFHKDIVSYGLTIRVEFEMEGSTRFEYFDSLKPFISTFREGMKLLVTSKLDNDDRVSVTRKGDINQAMETRIGNLDLNIEFVDSKSSRDKIKEYFLSKPNSFNYMEDLNVYLNKRAKTFGKYYITGKIFIQNSTLVDNDLEKGICGCADAIKSNASDITATFNLYHIFTYFCVFMMLNFQPFKLI